MITLYILAVFASGVIVGTIAHDVYLTVRDHRRLRRAVRRLQESTMVINDCVDLKPWKPLPPQEFQGYSE